MIFPKCSEADWNKLTLYIMVNGMKKAELLNSDEAKEMKGPVAIHEPPMGDMFLVDLSGYMETARKIGKIPWSCAFDIQKEVAFYCMKEGITEQATMDETINFSKKERS